MMAELKPVEFKVRKFDPSVTLKVTTYVTRELKVRHFIAVRLIRLAAWILGMSSEITLKPMDEKEDEEKK